MGAKYDEATKRKAVARVAKGETQVAVAEAMGMSTKAVMTWCKELLGDEKRKLRERRAQMAHARQVKGGKKSGKTAPVPARGRRGDALPRGRQR